jgi:hypothetical protein
MFIPPEIIARKRDPILPKWRALLKFIKNTGIVTGPGVKVTQTPNGTLVDAERSFRPWSHPFKVSTDGTTATIRAGLVNGVSPYLNGVRINGIDDDGNEIEVPPLEITHDGTLITYIAIVLNLPAGNETMAISDSPEAIRIEHVTSLPENFAEGGTVSDQTRGVYPIAALYWNGKNDFNKRLQIVHHNLGHRFIRASPKEGIVGRHFFWAS